MLPCFSWKILKEFHWFRGIFINFLFLTKLLILIFLCLLVSNAMRTLFLLFTILKIFLFLEKVPDLMKRSNDISNSLSKLHFLRREFLATWTISWFETEIKSVRVLLFLSSSTMHFQSPISSSFSFLKIIPQLFLNPLGLVYEVKISLKNWGYKSVSQVLSLPHCKDI